MRGKVAITKITGSRARITPACAGKSTDGYGHGQEAGDHPRVCGEKDEVKEYASFPEGSPPRVRGKVRARYPSVLYDRITPACAGKSAANNSYGFRIRDHPRVCGEKSWQVTRPATLLGSPPRVRGKVHDVQKEINHGRITPACAGKSSCHTPPTVSKEDHPRVCGEKQSSFDIFSGHSGSPPRVRGKARLGR